MQKVVRNSCQNYGHKSMMQAKHELKLTCLAATILQIVYDIAIREVRQKQQRECSKAIDQTVGWLMLEC